jgi:peptidoglycan/LPS O-acetylase OafA/YrhL
MNKRKNEPSFPFLYNLLKPGPEGNENRKTVIKYSVATVIVVICASVILNIFSNSGTAEYNSQKYFFLYTLPFIFTIAIMLNLLSNPKAAKLFLKLLGVFAILIFIVYYYSTTNDTMNIASNTNYFIFILIVLLGLALVYQLLIEYLSKLRGIPGFIAQLLFYIPCIFTDVINYFLEQVRMTSYTTYALLFIEIILIIVYAYLPEITYKATGQDNSIQLLSDIRYLDDGKQILAGSDVLKIPKNINEPNSTEHYLTNYCISMWVFINPHPPSHLAYKKETNILTYGYTDEHGVQHVKPMIRYYGGGGGDDQLIERNKYVFYFSKYPPTEQYTSSKHTFYDVTLENQKWNQIILNYNRNKVELYINGTLERTFVMTKDMPQYNDLDQIVVGEEEGLDGAICNITYYRHPLSREQIALSYNSTSLSNLPIPRKR